MVIKISRVEKVLHHLLNAKPILINCAEDYGFKIWLGRKQIFLENLKIVLDYIDYVVYGLKSSSSHILGLND